MVVTIYTLFNNVCLMTKCRMLVIIYILFILIFYNMVVTIYTLFNKRLLDDAIQLGGVEYVVMTYELIP